jgi:hypothetical protein
MLIPVEQATIVDTWSALSICGTGSHVESAGKIFLGLRPHDLGW